jgi:hypothetical protein
MNKLGNAIAFIFGAAAGSVVTWKLIEKKYKKIAQEEIESVKETYSRRNSKPTEDSAPAEEPVKEQTTEEASQIIKEARYTAEYKEGEQMSMDIQDKDAPYTIPPEEFGETDYERVSLTYFADKVLADDYGDIVDDIEGTVGYKALESFGEYEDDSVFVRNDGLQVDYEILLDLDNYSDSVTEKED